MKQLMKDYPASIVKKCVEPKIDKRSMQKMDVTARQNEMLKLMKALDV